VGSETRGWHDWRPHHLGPSKLLGGPWCPPFPANKATTNEGQKPFLFCHFVTLRAQMGNGALTTGHWALVSHSPVSLSHLFFRGGATRRSERPVRD